jgi:hypothetical protein
MMYLCPHLAMEQAGGHRPPLQSNRRGLYAPTKFAIRLRPFSIFSVLVA